MNNTVEYSFTQDTVIFTKKKTGYEVKTKVMEFWYNSLDPPSREDGLFYYKLSQEYIRTHPNYRKQNIKPSLPGDPPSWPVDSWVQTIHQLPPQGVVVDTKIEDKHGVRNVAKLIFKDGLFFTPDMAMYVYYIPTHWKKNDG